MELKYSTFGKSGTICFFTERMIFMKTRKAIAILSAAVMSLCALPMASVSAADAAVPGDVDGDGVLTGHDAAVVSRYLEKGDITLTDEQLKTADVNGDGKADTADADWMYENMTYGLACTAKNSYDPFTLNANGCNCCLFISNEGIGKTITITDARPAEEVFTQPEKLWIQPDLTLTQVQFNLLDVDGDGKITSMDTAGILTLAAYAGALDGDFSAAFAEAFHGNYFFGA